MKKKRRWKKIVSKCDNSLARLRELLTNYDALRLSVINAVVDEHTDNDGFTDVKMTSPLHFVQHLSLKGEASAAPRFNCFIYFYLIRNMALLLRRAVSEAD